jgi:hypothetical protein
MSASDPQIEPPQIIAERRVIAYAATPSPRRRRWWPYGVVGAYLLLVTALLTAPFWTPFWFDEKPDFQGMAILAVTVTLLTVCGLAMLLPHVARRRPITRRTILIPIVASGLLLGLLMVGGGFALAQLFAPETGGSPYRDRSPSESTLWMVIIGASAIWAAWSVVFGLMARHGDPAGLGLKLHRILIAGSVLELVVAVPAHIIVRRRGDCCGYFVTGAGICVGIVVALVSFGPSVLLLYYKRCKQIDNRRPVKASEEEAGSRTSE